MMLRSYMLAYDHASVELIALIQFLEAEGMNWRAPGLPGCVLITSRLTLNSLNATLHSFMQSNRYMLVQICADNVQGWADPDTWKFLHEPVEPPATFTPITGFSDPSTWSLRNALAPPKDQ